MFIEMKYVFRKIKYEQSVKDLLLYIRHLLVTAHPGACHHELADVRHTRDPGHVRSDPFISLQSEGSEVHNIDEVAVLWYRQLLHLVHQLLLRLCL